MFLSFPSQGKLFLILFPNRVEKESLRQSNDHISYTRGQANLFDKEIALGTTNWLRLQCSTVIFQDPSVGFRCQTGVVYVIWWGLPPGVFKGGSNICSYPQDIVFLIFCLVGGQGEERSFQDLPFDLPTTTCLPHKPRIQCGVVPMTKYICSSYIFRDWEMITECVHRSREVTVAGQAPGPHLSPSSHTPQVTVATLTLCSTVLENVCIFPFSQCKATRVSDHGPLWDRTRTNHS